MHNEFQFIKIIKDRTKQTKDSGVVKGIGDDAAIIRPAKDHQLLVTTDLLIEEIDFKRDWITPQLLGHKSLAVSLSDIAAMGARPRWALISIGLPKEIWRSKFKEEFYEGYLNLANKYNVSLIGGDISSTPDHIVIDSFVIGESAKDRSILRSEAKPGDLIFITGSLGGSALGLQLLNQGIQLKRANSRRRTKHNAYQELLLRHLQPEPRLSWGQTLSQKRLATSMIDISDGLSSDLMHICEESNTGAYIEAAKIPIDPNLSALDHTNSNLQLALNGGEDYELLFTVSPKRAHLIPKEIEGIQATCVGEMTDETNRVYIKREKRRYRLRPEGFNHFKN
jgi:thiamine-monophosphate kinase